MKKGRNTAADILYSNDEVDDVELSEDLYQERILLLKTLPPSRRVQLMAHGATEIRCTSCDLIRPLAGAEESEEGWICENCMSEMIREPKYSG